MGISLSSKNFPVSRRDQGREEADGTVSMTVQGVTPAHLPVLHCLHELFLMLFKHYFYEVAGAAAAQNLDVCLVAKKWDVIGTLRQQRWALHRNETLPCLVATSSPARSRFAQTPRGACAETVLKQKQLRPNVL